MKTKQAFILLMLLTISSGIFAQQMQEKNGHPVLQANTDWTEYIVGEDHYPGWWSVAPQVAHDTLQIICYGTEEAFTFKTDRDSISFVLQPNTVKDFYVKLGAQYAHTVIQGLAFQANPIAHEQESEELATNIKYQEEANDYLETLQQKFPLDFLREGMSDTEVALAVLHWTNSQWKHNGNNSPSKNDAITILNEVKEGKQFPCFAYAIVLRDQLTAIGFQARTVYLKTQDAKHRKNSPGHVATEVYLKDLQKWVFLDGQFNVMPFFKGVPLNAVEFQEAISKHYDEFELRSLAEQKTSKKNYVGFVYDYLFYIDTSLDNRYGAKEKHTLKGKRSMMLVPLGAPNLEYIDFWKMQVDYCVYTSSLKDFYAKPVGH